MTEHERDLFTRLATMEAICAIEKLDESQQQTDEYSEWWVVFFRIMASGGSAVFWFGGSWYGKLFAGDIHSSVCLHAR